MTVETYSVPLVLVSFLKTEMSEGPVLGVSEDQSCLVGQQVHACLSGITGVKTSLASLFLVHPGKGAVSLGNPLPFSLRNTCFFY